MPPKWATLVLTWSKEKQNWIYLKRTNLVSDATLNILWGPAPGEKATLQSEIFYLDLVP